MEKKPEEIIKEYCGCVEERINSCADQQVAMILKERLCWELKINCKSEIVNNFMTKYVDDLIKSKFHD